jgi:hypothetical protein
MTARARGLALVVPLLASAGEALACPVCNTGTGDAVRAGIFDGSFVATLASALAPFPVLLGLVGALHRGWTPNRILQRGARSGRERP